jgi:hypothetical protein
MACSSAQVAEHHIFGLLSLFWKNKSKFMRSPCCLCVCESPGINFWMSQPMFMKLAMYIMTPEPISTVYFINISHHSVSMCIPLLLLGSSLIKTLLQQQQKNCMHFYAVCVVSKESRQLVLPRTSCFSINSTAIGFIVWHVKARDWTSPSPWWKIRYPQIEIWLPPLQYQ